MSGRAGPNVVIDGLIMYLDPSNPKSYISGSSTVTDLVNNVRSGYNADAYSGSIDDTGANLSVLNDSLPVWHFKITDTNFIRLPPQFWDPDAGDPPFTVSVWFKTHQQGVIFGQNNDSEPQNGTGWSPAFYVNSNGNLVINCFYGTAGTNDYAVTSEIVDDSEWHNVVSTYDGTTERGYVDGSFSTTNGKNQASYATTYYYYLGAGKATSWFSITTSYFTGSIGVFQFWDRTLSADEVLQNYNALRGRYGR